MLPARGKSNEIHSLNLYGGSFRLGETVVFMPRGVNIYGSFFKKDEVCE